ncbi:MAG: DUF3990 domain-containing protein [Treponema sp.]|nr:DUF3990 domain-containing protein [Treponema sp.]
MILYHGSYTAIRKPNLSHARETTDFGKGFYTTAIQSQAEKWAGRFKLRQGSGVVTSYEINEAELINGVSGVSVLEFDSYSLEWLDFIISCRQGQPTADYDLIIGGIANDDVFNTLTVYLRGYIEKAEAIKRLRYEKPNIQYCFKKQAIMDQYLVYLGHSAL